MSAIPKHFHFIFGLREQTEAFHLCWYLCLKSCRAIYPDFRITLYYLNEPWGPYWDRIKPEIELVTLDAPPSELDETRYADHEEGRFIQSSSLQYAHQSDVLRLQLLKQHGGIYADIDSIFVRPYPTSFFEQPCVMGREAEDAEPPTLCNAVILAAQDSLFVERWLDRISDVFDGSWNRHSCIEPALIADTIPEQISIVGAEPFFYFRFDRKGLTDLLGRVTPLPESVCSIHLWNHLWWEPWRNDFIRFNNQHITETFIRNTDTTYNLLARQYL